MPTGPMVPRACLRTEILYKSDIISKFTRWFQRSHATGLLPKFDCDFVRSRHLK